MNIDLEEEKKKAAKKGKKKKWLIFFCWLIIETSIEIIYFSN
jgi:hypothetical protein